MQLSQALSSAGQSAEALEHADRALALTDAGKDDAAAFGAQLCDRLAFGERGTTSEVRPLLGDGSAEGGATSFQAQAQRKESDPTIGFSNMQ